MNDEAIMTAWNGACLPHRDNKQLAIAFARAIEAAVLAAHPPAAPADTERLTGCGCRWRGDVYICRCEIHDSWFDVIHEWAERAKNAERQLAPDAVTMTRQQFDDYRARIIAETVDKFAAHPPAQDTQDAKEV